MYSIGKTLTPGDTLDDEGDPSEMWTVEIDYERNSSDDEMINHMGCIEVHALTKNLAIDRANEICDALNFNHKAFG